MITESLPYSRYVIQVFRDSRIDPGYKAREDVALSCPHCRAKIRPLLHNESTTCGCGLHVVRSGNALKCSLRGPQAR